MINCSCSYIDARQSSKIRLNVSKVCQLIVCVEINGYTIDTGNMCLHNRPTKRYLYIRPLMKLWSSVKHEFLGDNMSFSRAKA